MKLLYVFAYKWACASGKAALARAHSKTCRQVGSALGTRSVLECGTQFRFAYETGALGVTRRILSHTAHPARPMILFAETARLEVTCVAMNAHSSRRWL